jgi:hypothetical protein
MNTDFCGLLVTHGIAVGGRLLCIYKRQLESGDKGITSLALAGNWGWYTPFKLDSIDQVCPGNSGRTDKASGWSWPARIEAECRLFSKAAVSGLSRLTTAFDSKQPLARQCF